MSSGSVLNVTRHAFKWVYLGILIALGIITALLSCSPSSSPEIRCMQLGEGSREYDITIMHTTNWNAVFYEGDTVYIDNQPLKIEGTSVSDGHIFYNAYTLDSLLIDPYGGIQEYFSASGLFVHMDQGVYFIGEGSGKEDFLTTEFDLRHSFCEVNIPLITSADTALFIKCPLGEVGDRWLYREEIGVWSIYKEYIGDTVITTESSQTSYNTWIIEWQFDMDNDGNIDDFIECREYYSRVGLIRRETKCYSAVTAEIGGQPLLIENYYTRISQLD